MKTKVLYSVLFVAFLFAIANVLALSYSVSTPADLTKSVNSTSFTITNNEAIALNFTVAIPASMSDGTNTVAISTPSSTSFSLAAGSTSTITINRGTVSSSFRLGAYTSPININAVNSSDSSISTNATTTLQFRSTYCQYGASTNTTRYLEIIRVKDTSSTNDWEWKPGDTVDVDVRVKYTNTQDSDDSIDAVIKLDLYDSISNEYVDLDNSDEFEREISLDEGSSQTETFNIDVPIEDIVDGASRYKLYVKVYEDGEEDTLCTDKDNNNNYFQDITIEKKSYEVILKSLDVTSPVPCGQQATVSATAWNIGNNDEDQVYVSAYNRELGLINVSSNVFSLDQGDSNRVDIDFMVPANATEKTYDIILTGYYKYSKSSEIYREETSENYRVALKVEGCTKTPSVSITPVLSDNTPRAVIGNQVTIEATLKNTGTTSADYTVDVSGNTQWSSVSSIEPKTVTLDAGESKKVLITLSINSDAQEGDEEFTIRVTSNGIAKEQKVLLTLEKSQLGNAILENITNNWFIYAIVLINVILIIAIIIVVRRIVSKD